VRRVTVTDPGETRCGITSFRVTDKEPEEIKTALAEVEPRINVTTSTRQSTMFDMDARGLTSVVRASLHYYNTEREVDRFVAIVADLAGPS